MLRLVRTGALARVLTIIRARPEIASQPVNGRVVVPLVTLVAVLGLGLYLRLSAIGSLPFLEDEYVTALQSIGIMKTWMPTLPSGLVQWAEPVALPYLMALVWQVTGPDIVVGRLLSVGAGTLSILMAYLLGRRLQGRMLGLVFAALVATNVWSIASSVFFRSYALGELSVLVISYLSMRWLQGQRSLEGYLLLLGASLALALVGHYLLLLVIPVVAMLPAISWVSGIIGSRIHVRSPRGAQASVWRGMLLQVRLDRPMLLIFLFVGSAAGLGFWVLFEHGVLAAKIIGAATGEFFTSLPENAGVTFKPFFVQSLQKFYGSGLLALVAAGTLVMVARTGRRGLAILLYFAFPFVLLSTIFSSLTVTSLFDRYIFPYDVALLLALAFLLVWVGKNLALLLNQMLPRAFQQRVSILAVLVPALMVFGLVELSPSFLFRFHSVTSPALIDAWVRDREVPQTPSFHRAATYIKEHVALDDTVVSTRDWGLPFELPGMQGYWLMGNPKEVALTTTRTERGLISRYTGYPAISNLGQFLDLIAEKPTGWLVVPYYHYSPDVLTPGIWSFIHAQLTLVPEASDTTIGVFHWERSRMDFIPLPHVPEAYGNTFRLSPLENGVIQVEGRPGSVDWTGVRYPVAGLLSARDVIVDLQIQLNGGAENADIVGFDLILEEGDGDRWHLPKPVPVDAGERWKHFTFGFSDLIFWPLGEKTPEPEKIASIMVEAIDTRALAFTAQVKVSLIPVVP